MATPPSTPKKIQNVTIYMYYYYVYSECGWVRLWSRLYLRNHHRFIESQQTAWHGRQRWEQNKAYVESDHIIQSLQKDIVVIPRSASKGLHLDVSIALWPRVIFLQQTG